MHLNNLFNETIRKEGDKYVVRSKKGKSMGSYDSKSAAEKRLRQVEMFKHMAESIKLSEAERDIQVEVPGVGVYTADTLGDNIINNIEKLHQAAQEGNWEQVEYSLDSSKMGATLLLKAKALVQALKQNRMLESNIAKEGVIKKHAGKIIPGAGAAMTAYDAGSEAKKGNYGRAAQKVAAAGAYMIPGVGIPLGLLIDPDTRELTKDLLNKAAKPEDNEELLRGTGPMGMMP